MHLCSEKTTENIVLGVICISKYHLASMFSVVALGYIGRSLPFLSNISEVLEVPFKYSADKSSPEALPLGAFTFDNASYVLKCKALNLYEKRIAPPKGCSNGSTRQITFIYLLSPQCISFSYLTSPSHC